eukprot:7286113-Prymnesium_polylepis.1
MGRRPGRLNSSWASTAARSSVRWAATCSAAHISIPHVRSSSVTDPARSAKLDGESRRRSEAQDNSHSCSCSLSSVLVPHWPDGGEGGKGGVAGGESSSPICV